MGSTVLRIITAVLTGIGVMVTAHVADIVPPEGLDALGNILYTGVIALLKFGADYLVRKFGPPPTTV